MRFIACLEKQTYKNYTLVVIDDGSKDDTVASILKSIPSARVLQGNGSLWWGGSLHKGYQHLADQSIPDDDLVLIANDDIEFDACLLEKIVSYMQKNPNYMVSAMCFSRQTGELLDRGVTVDWRALSFRQADADYKINCLATRCLFMRASAFRKSKGFFPRLLPHYLSDYEFTIRAYQQGATLAVAPEVRIRYDETTTGLHYFEGRGIREYFRWVFSIKSPVNPIYLSSFLLLRCPWRWLPFNLIRVWGGFLRRGLQSLSTP
jgi:GT2 family glycosyltransferase